LAQDRTERAEPGVATGGQASDFHDVGGYSLIALAQPDQLGLAEFSPRPGLGLQNATGGYFI
jgi:hypothetical protein